MHKILVFTATYNESENIKEFIEEVFRSNQNLDLLIIDDNSPDGTSEIIKNLSKNNKNINLMIRDSKLGLNTAHITAYEYAIKNKYDKLITLDADLSHDPKEIQKIICLLDENAFVVGSRYMEGGKNDMERSRLFLSILGNKFIKLLHRSKSTEFTSSYRGFNLDKLSNFNFNQIKSNGYSFFMETVIRINNMGFDSYEIPIHFKNREYGVSKIPRIEIFRTLFNVFFLLFKKK